MSLCKYKDIFGKPKEGVHKLTIPGLNIAFIDTILVILSAWFLTFYFKKTHFLIIFLVLMFIGVLFHKVFCVNTRLNVFLSSMF